MHCYIHSRATSDFIKPGVTTWDIDQFVQRKSKKRGGSAPKLDTRDINTYRVISMMNELILLSQNNYKTVDLVKMDFRELKYAFIRLC